MGMTDSTGRILWEVIFLDFKMDHMRFQPFQEVMGFGLFIWDWTTTLKFGRAIPFFYFTVTTPHKRGKEGNFREGPLPDGLDDPRHDLSLTSDQVVAIVE
jgi:hypothetical protein